ncbi:MAG: tRNA pseudouridine(55) synthase TruB [Planctomycetaceae bacterium]
MSQLFGLLNVNKPAVWSSRKVVDCVARAVRPAKAGHAGTLDPMATGVLVVAVGRATRLIGFVQEQSKSYSATFLLGQRSNTDDVTGEVTEHAVEREPARDELETALRRFVGRIEQVPPQFSAVHIDGRRAYKLARQGETLELHPRTVEVFRAELTRYEYPKIDLDIECGSGTYIRSVGRDLGEMLGCGAVMSRLERTAIGGFRLDDAVDPHELSPERVAEHLLPAALAVGHLPAFHCTADDVQVLRHGRRIPLRNQLRSPAFSKSAASDRGETIAVFAPDGELAALGESQNDGTLAPRHVFCDAL